jgi:putative ABC transport system ATP-binding protein
MAEILRLDNVYKWVDVGESRTEILRGVSLSVQSGEFLAIMGASGSGKSTLLNIVGLLDSPSVGGYRLLGIDVLHLSEAELASLRARSIGFVFQAFNLLPYLTVQQNVELPLSYAGHLRVSERSHPLLAQVRLSDRAQAYPTTLSGGERQRVAIARALANEPALILADEPTGSLDSKTGAQIIELIQQLHRTGSTVLLVTHDESIASRAQKVLHMKDGRFE